MGRLVKLLLSNWPLLLILVLAVATRIYKIDELFYFTYDESIPAFIGRRLILWHHLPLIGGVTPFNFHLGPYFYWFYAILLFFSKLNPIVWGYAGAAISAITTLLIFKICLGFGSKKLAITASIIWAFSFLANIYDRHLWALYWGPIFALAILFSLLKIISGNRKFIYLLGFILALSIHADLSNLVFLLLAALAWKIYKVPIKKDVFISLLFIPLLALPLLIFDIRHDFSNTRPALQFLSNSHNTNKPGFSFDRFSNNMLIFPRTLSRVIYKFGDDEISKQYSYCSQFVQEKYKSISLIFVISSLAVIVVYIFWANLISRNKLHQLSSLLIVLYFASLQLYGTVLKGDIFEHYITGLLPIFAIILALLISRLPRILWIAVLGLFLIVNLYKLAIAKNSHGFKYKKAAIEYSVRSAGHEDFSLDSLSTCWRYSGYRYMFAYIGKEPVKSYVDPNFGYLYGTTKIADNHLQTVIAFVTHDFAAETADFYKRYAVFKSHEKASSIFGNIEVIVLDNTSRWFDKGTD